MRVALAAFVVLLAAGAAHAQTTLERGNRNEVFAIAVSPSSGMWHVGRVPVLGNQIRAREIADRDAMRNCGSGCIVQLRFGPEPACMVLARGTPAWGGAFASSPEQARTPALADCRGRNQGCRVQTAAYCYR